MTKKETELKSTSSHDGYIKKQLMKIEAARSFFMNYLPLAIRSIMNWDTLRLAPGEFIRKDLRYRRSDILYKVNLKGDFSYLSAFLFYHIEHQKESERDMSYRVFDYQHGTWELVWAQRPGQDLPLIYSIVVFQGPGTWTAPLNFHEFMKVPPILKKYVPQFSYDLIDLTAFSDEQIKGFVGLQLTFFALKYIQSPDLLRIIQEKIIPLCRELEKKKRGLEYIEDFYYYLFSNRRDLEKDVIIDALDQDPKDQNIKEVIMTIADRLRLEGKKIGEEIGEERGEKKANIRMLSNQLRIKFHEEADDWIPRLEELSPEGLKWVEEKILTEDKIENFFPQEH